MLICENVIISISFFYIFMESQLQCELGLEDLVMQHLYNVSEHFSKTLDEVRGPERKRNYLKQARAWVKPSIARRSAAKALGYAGVSLVLGALGFALFKRRGYLIFAVGRTQEHSNERLAG